MSGTTLIRVQDVRISFPLSYDLLPTVQSKATWRLRNWMRGNFTRRRIRVFNALNNISLTAKDGEIIGIVGPNGCGKTTLLRTIAGIYAPDEGSVEVKGELSTLLSVGTGLNNNLSGRKNIYVAGFLRGMKKQEIEDNIDEIIEYAELEEFIDVPMKNYSNGMISRLGFAISTAMRPQILLIDEVFSVGDLRFRQKSEKTIEELLASARCQLIVTHNLPFVREHCTRAVFINKGAMIADGDSNHVVDAYEDWAASYTGGKYAKIGSRFVTAG